MGLFNKLKDAAAEFGLNIPQQNQNNGQYTPSYSQRPVQQPAPTQSSDDGLYNPQLEKLIDFALADGELTEQEKQVLFKKAEGMGIDLDEFEMVLNARLYERNKATSNQPSAAEGSAAAPKSNKFGDIKKCPACGAMIQSFTTRCPECGYEFRNIDANQGVEKLFEMLNDVESQANTASSTLAMFGLAKDKTIERKKSIIMNFPIPNTKEDILEFLSLAIPNAKVSFWSQDDTAKEMAPTWKKKCEQIIMKAKFSMKEDKQALEEIAAYAKELKIRF